MEAILVILFIVVAPANGKLSTVTDRNRTLSSGSEVSFNCTTDNDDHIRWTFIASGSTNAELINSRHKVNFKFDKTHNVSFDNATGQSQLTITRLLQNDTGTYVCSESKTSSSDIEFSLWIVPSPVVSGFLTATTDTTTEVEPGQNVTFGCRTGQSGVKIRWMFYTIVNGTVKFQWIHNGEQMGPRFVDRFTVNFDQQRNEGTMSIHDVQPKDAGLYNCSETNTAVKALTFRLEVRDANGENRSSTADSSAASANDTNGILSNNYSFIQDYIVYAIVGLVVALISIVLCVIVAARRCRRKGHGSKP